VDDTNPEGPRLAAAASAAATYAGDRLLTAQLGHVRVRDGREIAVQPVAGADPADVEGALWGTAMAVLLQQRRVLPMHIAAVAVDGQAVGFVGPVAAGKSSLAGAFVGRGHRLVTDDLAALTYDEAGRPALQPGPPILRIWGSSARQLGWSTDEAHRLKAGVDKFRYEMTDRLVEGPRRLAAVYVLAEQPVAETVIRPVTGFEKFEVFHTGATYNAEFLDTPDLRTWHFGEVSRLAQQVPTFLVARPAGDLDLDDLANQVEQHFADLRTAD
jgi:hypothetical protein